MRRILLIVFLCSIGSDNALAETVDTLQDIYLHNTGGVKLNTVACNAAAASRWTGWIRVDTKASLVLDVDFIDANSNENWLDMRCETSRSSATAADAGRDLHVIVSTSAAGISNTVPLIWRYGGMGAPPGSKSWTWEVDHVPSLYINCLFECSGAVEAADTISVYVRGITP